MGSRRVLGYALFLSLVIGMTGVPSWAQDASSTSKTLHAAVSDGVKAIQEERHKRAVQVLENVLLDTLAYVDPAHGPGTYWLGQAYAETGDVDRALRIWRAGLLTLKNTEQFSVRLADSFIHHTFTERVRDNYGLAANVYLEMLRRAGSSSSTEEEAKSLVQRLRHLALVLPEERREEFGLPESDQDIVASVLGSVDGQALVQWWRTQDPLPGTLQNEQLREHLQRVSYSLKKYGHSETPYGFDDRGKVYVRFGPPDQTVSVNYSQSKLTDIIYEREVGVDVTISDFPENEFWSYGQYDRRIYYIFVQRMREGPYRIGRTRDLLPRSLQGPFNTNTRRGQQRSIYALAVLRAIYRKYKPFHPNLAARHDEVANYLSYVTTGGLEQFPAGSDRPPDVFTSKFLSQIRNDDEVAARRREEYAPNQLSTEKREIPTLNVVARTARFLNEEGNTRTEVYWAPGKDALLLNSEQQDGLQDRGFRSFGDYLLRFTATQETADYQTRTMSREHFRLQNVREGKASLPPRTFTTERGDSTVYHLSMQWDLYLVDSEEDSIGPKIKMATERRDSLRALPRNERMLVMSDLKPMVLPEGETSLDAARPYPFRSLTSNTSLALYFETYNLMFNANDKTEYTVEYEIHKEGEDGGLLDWILGDDEQRTAVTTDYTGSSRTAEEYILLGLSTFDIGTSGTLSVTVKLTDETSGREVERSIDFEIRPSLQ